jgi:hypothetical protein
MSGMFQRNARRHADRSDEPVESEAAGEPAPDTPVADGAAADASTADDKPGEATADLPTVDAPTERIEAVAPSVPPQTIDLTTKLAATPDEAAAAAASVSATPAAAQPDPAAPQTAVEEPVTRRPGFRARGRMRRRLRYLRKLRELQARDLGGLVFDLRRFERKRDDLIAQKIDQIRACDDELRALELALNERRDLRDVHEPGIGGTCPRCFAVFGSADRFCASCGAALGGAVQGPAQVPLAPAPEAPQPAPAPPAPAAPPATGGGGPQQ